MSTVKISELPVIPRLNEDTTQTLIAGVDLLTGVTGKMTTKVLAQSLYSNDVLNVGNNAIIFPGVVGQFAGSDSSYLQINVQNFDGNGSTDMVLTADDGTDNNYYIDMGIQGSNCSAGTLYPHDGYILMQGDEVSLTGNLIIGTTSTAANIQTRFISGGIQEENVYAVFELDKSHFLNDVIVDGSLTGPSINAINSYAEAGFGQANVAFIQANTVFGKVNAAFTAANSAGSYANSAYAKANTGADNAITAITNASVADNKAVTAGSYANTALGTATASFIAANTAWSTANNALANTTGTFGGSLSISGNANVGSHLIVANNSFDYSNTSLVKITGAPDAVIPPANPGYMLEIIGINGVPSRIINTGYGTGAYGLYAARHANGTAASPTAVLTNDVLGRFSGSGHNGTSFTATGQGRIDIVADEDFTVANTGSRIEFYNTIPKTNTVTKIATFNSNTASFTGAVNPMKGFEYTPNNITSLSTEYTVDFARDSMTRMSVNDNMTVTLQNYVSGKIVEVWITNAAGQNKTITHGCLANNSTSKATTFTIQSNSCAFLKYFSIDGDNANTFVSITA